MKTRTLNHLIALVALLLLLAIPANSQETSDLWPNGGLSWDPQTSRLKDFTNVGYLSGTVAIPDATQWPIGVDVTDPQFGAIPDDGIDDSQAFIDAIAACPDNHAVYVPNGRYTILQQIVPDRDYFVLRGEDMYGTVLHFPKYLNEIYIQEVGFGNPEYDDGSNGARHTGIAKGFFRVEGGTHRSIENLTFEFREQMKAGHWEHKGASAISYSDNVVDSWIRNIYIKNGDNALMIGLSERLSVLNIIFDHYIGRPDIIGSGSSHRWVGHIGVAAHNSRYSLFHNIEFKGNYFHELDNNNVPKNCVFSNFSGTDVSLHHHGGGSNNNLYTNASVGNGPGIASLKDTQNNETHWCIYGDDVLAAPTDPVNLTNGHVFVGYDSTQTEIMDANHWYEVIDPSVLFPQNIYLAQLQLPSINKPLPEAPPASPPSPYTGDVIRINPVEDSFTDASEPGVIQDPGAKSFSIGNNMYFKFNLSEVSLNSIARVRLRVSASKFENAPVVLKVSSVGDDTWSEDTLTYTGQPAAVTELDSIEITEDAYDQIVEFDVTSFVQSEWGAGDDVISLVIEKASEGSVQGGIRSREMGIAPELVIEQVADPVPGAPAAPADVKSYSLIGNVQLDWADNPEPDVVSYNVYRSTVSQGLRLYEVPIASGLLTSDFVDVQTYHQTGWDIGMMRYDIAYYYRVTAVDAHGYESESALEIVGTAKGPYDDNLPPSFNPNPVLPAATQYAPYTANLYEEASDPEEDPLYFSKVNGPEWLHIDHDGSISGTPRLGDTGTYFFTVQVNSLGSGRDETTVQITVNPGAPDAPLAVDAISGDASVALDWKHDSEGSANFTFNVFRATVAGGPYTQIDSGLTTSDYTDTGLTNGTTYYYVVTATNASGQSSDSVEVFATPVAGLSIVTNYIGGVITDSASWDTGLPVGQWGRIDQDASMDTSIVLDGYSILHTGGVLVPTGIKGLQLANGSTWITEGLDASTATSFRGVDVSSGASFTLYQGTINTAGNRDWKITQTGSSIVVNGGTINLGRHLLIASDGEFTINGGVINGNPGAGDIGVRSHSNTGTFNFNGGITTVNGIDLGGNNTIFNFGGASAGSLTASAFSSSFGSNSTINFLPGSRMSLTVSGEDEWAAAKWAAGDLTYNGQGVAQLGSWAAVTAPDGLASDVRFEYDSATETLMLANGDLPPSAPQGLSAASGDRQITLSWQMVSEPNVVGYAVYRSDTTGGPYALEANLNVVDEYTDTELVNGTTYYYVVTAINADLNESDASLEQSGIPADASPPVAPASLESAAGNGFVALNWADSGEYDLASYTVYRSETTGGSYSMVGSGLTTSGFVDSLAVNDTNYYYVVTARDTSGNESGWSNERFETPTAGATVNTVFAGGDLNHADSWNFGSPNQSSIIGTVTVNGTAGTLMTDFNLTHTSGILSVIGSGAVGFSGGSYTLDGGTWDAGANGFTALNGAVITINSGTLTTGGTYNSNISDSTFIVNGGTVWNDGSGSRDMSIGGSTFTMNGGVMAIGGNLSNASYQTASILNFNGGTFDANGFDFQIPSLATFGGTTAGSVTVTSSNGLAYDWLADSQISLTVSGADEWAAAAWAAGTLTYNGLGVAELGSWAQVSAPGGLGNDINFAYDSNTETLALETTVWVVATDFLGGDLATAGSWTNGLPTTPGNSGTIAVSGTIQPTATVDYYVTQTAGTISNADFNSTTLSDGIWNLDGGIFTVRGLTLAAGATSFHVSGNGIADLGNNNKDLQLNAGTSFSVTGGTVTLGRHLKASGGVFTITDGTLTGDVDTWIGTPGFQSNGVFNFNGGTTTAYQLDPSGSNTTFNFGGSSEGSLSVTGFAGSFGAGSTINFLPGTLMSLAISGVDEWAAAAWAAGHLTYNGQSTTELGSWAAVTTPDGLEEGVYFAYDSNTETLTLVSPEPIPTGGTDFLGGDINNPDDWDNSLPSYAENPGTVSASGTIEPNSTIHYDVTQTAGTISNANFSGTQLDGGAWNLVGGTFSVRGLSLLAGSTAFHVSGSGVAELGNNNSDVVLNAGSTFTVTGGAVTLGRDLEVNGAVLTIAGGTVTGDVDTSIGSFGFQSDGVLNFNGGTTTAFDLNLQGTGVQVNFGGTTSGSLIVDSIVGTNGVIDWTTGSLMTMTVSSSPTWAETEWNAGRLTYNGAGVATLGTWSTVTTTGFGDGNVFAYDSGTHTLALGIADTTAPDAPTGLGATAGIESVSLAWTANAEGDLASYAVYRSTSSNGIYNQVGTVTVPDTTFENTELTDGTMYYYKVSAVDTTGNESDLSGFAAVQPGRVNQAAEGEIFVTGTVTGTLAAVDSSDNVYQGINEIDTGTTTELEHVWVFEVTAAEVVTVFAEAYHSGNSEGDEFIFAYSTDDVNYTDMFTVTKTVDDDTQQYYILPGGTSGTVYIRVLDADRTGGNQQLDSIQVDELYIESQTTSAVPGAALSPSPADGVDEVKVDAQLSWSAGLGTVSYDVYFGTDPAPALQGNQAGTTFDPGALEAGTTYYWRVDAINSTGTAAGAVWSFTTEAAGPRLSTGVISGVDDSWQTFSLSESYDAPVIVASVVNASPSELPAVVRVRNAAGSSFEMKVQNPSGAALSGYTVHVTAVEAGVYTQAEHGVDLEAIQVTSTGTNGKSGGWGSSAMQQITTGNSYTNPVVLGQVMSDNDSNWSVFWSCDGSPQNPATASSVYVGKHVGEDTVTTRADETLGVIIIESGSGILDGVSYVAGLGADSVKGVDDAPAYSYLLSGLSSATSATVSSSGMDGGDGGWAVLFGSSPVSSAQLDLAINEDQTKDTERKHTAEQVSYLVFE